METEAHRSTGVLLEVFSWKTLKLLFGFCHSQKCYCCYFVSGKCCLAHQPEVVGESECFAAKAFLHSNVCLLFFFACTEPYKKPYDQSGTVFFLFIIFF